MSAGESQGSGVTVIVPTYNRADLIVESLESILAQSLPAEKIVVIDDGSSDNTREIVESFGDRISYVYKENGGKSSAVNVGLEYVDTEYVLVFDDDDILMPDALQALIAPLRDNPKLAFAHGRIEYFRTDPNGTKEIVSQPKFQDVAPGEHYVALLTGGLMCHLATLVRRDCYTALNGLDESFKRVQDDEFCLRLTSRYSGISIDKIVANCRVHDGIRGDKETQHAVKNRALVNLEFHRRMFARVRNETPLWAYLSGTEKSDLEAGEHLRALLTRAASMARHGLWNEFLEDIKLCEGVRTGYRSSLPSGCEDLISEALSRSVSSQPEMGKPGFPYDHIRAMLRSLGPTSRRAIMRGFYWAAADAWSRGKYWLAAKYVWTVIWTRFARARLPVGRADE